MDFGGIMIPATCDNFDSSAILAVSMWYRAACNCTPLGKARRLDVMKNLYSASKYGDFPY